MSYNFEYFYGTEAEHFIFFRIPKVLITDSRFKVMSTDSKLLYGLMLDRMGLSNRNGWVDEHNRVYIIYTMEEIIEDMGCARQKAAKLLDELDNIVGLIERKRQGLGKPNIIYVKNFICSEEIRFENQNSESMNTINQEVPKSNSRKYDNQTSRSMNVESQEVPKSNGNNTNTNNTDYNNTDFNKTKPHTIIKNGNTFEKEPIEDDEMLQKMKSGLVLGGYKEIDNSNYFMKIYLDE